MNALAIPEVSIRRGGRQLGRLALIGQLLLLAALVLAPVTLYLMQLPATPGMGFLAFMKQPATSPILGPVNLHELMRALVMLAALECMRRLGKALASGQIEGPAVVSMLGWLKWLVLLFALLCSISMEIVPDGQAALCRPIEACPPPFKLEWNLTITPLYIGVLLTVALSIAQRMIERIRLLKTENEGFV